MTQQAIRIRASALNSFADCPRREVMRMLREELAALPQKIVVDEGKTFTGSKEAGTEIHQAFSAAIKGEQPEQMAEIRDRMEETWREHGKLDLAPSDTDSLTKNVQRVNVAMPVLFEFINDHGAELAGMESERQLKGHFGTEIEISGKPDLIGNGKVFDLKTGRRLGDWSRQLAAYSALAGGSGEFELIALHLPVFNVDKTPIMTRKKYDPVLAKKEMEKAIEHLALCVKIYRASGYDSLSLMGNPNSMFCSPRTCPIWGTEKCSLGVGS